MTAIHPLRRWRKEKELTGTTLGRLIGVSKSTVSGYETGKRTPRMRTLKRIRELTGGSVTADHFLSMVEAAE